MTKQSIIIGGLQQGGPLHQLLPRADPELLRVAPPHHTLQVTLKTPRIGTAVQLLRSINMLLPIARSGLHLTIEVGLQPGMQVASVPNVVQALFLHPKNVAMPRTHVIVGNGGQIFNPHINLQIGE